MGKRAESGVCIERRGVCTCVAKRSLNGRDPLKANKRSVQGCSGNVCQRFASVCRSLAKACSRNARQSSRMASDRETRDDTDYSRPMVRQLNSARAPDHAQARLVAGNRADQNDASRDPGHRARLGDSARTFHYPVWAHRYRHAHLPDHRHDFLFQSFSRRQHRNCIRGWRHSSEVFGERYFWN